MKVKILIGLLLGLCLSQSLAAQDYLALSKEILNRNLEHPYLVFDNQSKQEMQKRIAADPAQAQILDLLLQQAG